MPENLTDLSRLDGDARRQRNIMLREAVNEVLRRQRELAWATFEEGKSVFLFAMPCRRRSESPPQLRIETKGWSRAAIG